MSESELREEILGTVIKHGKANDKMLSGLTIRWTKVNGAPCIGGITMRYKLKKGTKNTDYYKVCQPQQ